MTESDQLIALMKELDQKSGQLSELELKCLRRQLLSDKNNLLMDLQSILSFEEKIKQIVENEELIKLFFYRFLVSDHKTGQQFNGYYLRTKEKCKQSVVELFETMAALVLTTRFTPNKFEIKANTDLLAKALRDFQTKALKSMAENDIKVYDSKTIIQKFGLKVDSTGSPDTQPMA